MRLEWTDPALDDLEGIRDFIARDSAFYARRFIEHIFATVEGLTDHPRLGRQVPEAGRADVRELIFQSYRIIYLVEEDEDRIQVLSVMHGSRDLGSREKKPWEVG